MPRTLSLIRSALWRALPRDFLDVDAAVTSGITRHSEIQNACRVWSVVKNYELDTWGDASAGRNQIGDVDVELGERLVESGKAGGV
jgi:hypothetical protein